MIFFQQSVVVDKGMQPRDINAGRLDTLIGALLAALFCDRRRAGHHAAVSSRHQHRRLSGRAIRGSPQAVDRPRGRVPLSLSVFFEAGIVAAITISTSLLMHLGRFRYRAQPEPPPARGVAFLSHAVWDRACAAAALVLIPHFPLEFVVLTVNVIAVLAMPPALAFLLLLVNDREVMGEYVNGMWGNIAGVTVTILLVCAGLGFGLVTIFPHLLGD